MAPWLRSQVKFSEIQGATSSELIDSSQLAKCSGSTKTRCLYFHTVDEVLRVLQFSIDFAIMAASHLASILQMTSSRQRQTQRTMSRMKMIGSMLVLRYLETRLETCLSIISLLTKTTVSWDSVRAIHGVCDYLPSLQLQCPGLESNV